MKDTLTRFIAAVSAERDRRALRPVLLALVDRFSSQATASAGLVIKAGGGVLAKIGATDFQGIANGVPVKIAASTDMPVLTGLDMTAGAFNVYCFFIDSASVVTVLQGTEGASLAAVVFPEFPQGKALVGYLIVTYASAFIGNTTPLDTATTVYVNPMGAFDPNLLV